MKLREKLTADMKSAMKARDKARTSVLRMILSEMQYAGVAGEANKELSEEEALKVVLSYHKRLTKSLVDFPEGEKKVELQAEIEIVAEYLPKRAGKEEIERGLDEILSTTEERNFGLLMKQALSKFGKNADGKLISELLKQKLGK